MVSNFVHNCRGLIRLRMLFTYGFADSCVVLSRWQSCMSCIFARLCACLPAVLAAAIPLSLAAAGAEQTRSDRPIEQVLAMNKLDLIRKLDSELERYKSELGREQTVAGADKLRELFKRRAAIYETLEDFERTEASYDALVGVK